MVSNLSKLVDAWEARPKGNGKRLDDDRIGVASAEHNAWVVRMDRIIQSLRKGEEDAKANDTQGIPEQGYAGWSDTR